MKKVLSVLMVVAAMMFATNANAQIKFGLKGGLDVTNMSLSNDVFDASNKTGFFVGPMVKVTIPVVGLSFDAAALYDQKEAKVSVDDAETTMTQKSLNIPVNVRYGGASLLHLPPEFPATEYLCILSSVLPVHTYLAAHYNNSPLKA
jgi:hypothetical protein